MFFASYVKVKNEGHQAISFQTGGSKVFYYGSVSDPEIAEAQI